MRSKLFRLAIFLFVCFISILIHQADAQPIISFTNANAGTIQEGTGSSNVDVTIQNPNGNPTTVIVTHSGTATYGADYTLSPDTIVFPANSSAAQHLTYTVINDCADEGFETMIATLTNPTNGAQINIGTQTATISDNDPTPTPDCTYSVPANAIVADSTFSFFVSNRNFWVCESGELTLESNNHKVLIENGGIVHAKKSSAEIYVKSGGTVIVEQGNSNQIWAEDGATVTIQAGTCNIVYTDPGTTYTDNGTGTFHGTLTCAPLVIDYTAAPANGCVLTSSQNPEKVDAIMLFPNPTSGRFEIRYPQEMTLNHMEIYDSQGAFVMKLSAQDRNLNLVPGIYLVRLLFNNEVFSKRMIVNY